MRLVLLSVTWLSVVTLLLSMLLLLIDRCRPFIHTRCTNPDATPSSFLSKEKKLSLEQKAVSFEQKKRLLDKLVEETGIQNLGEFIERYNEQERTKAAILARIDAKSGMSTCTAAAIHSLIRGVSCLLACFPRFKPTPECTH